MENSQILLYDGSFNGFLSCVYLGFEQRSTLADIRNCKEVQKSLFSEMTIVETDTEKARRVWDTIEKVRYQAVKNIYFAFLSERKGIELLLYRYIFSLFRPYGQNQAESFPALQGKIETIAALVASEKRHMEKKVHFRQEYGQPATATVSPGYDILPLLTRYLRTLNAHQDWLLYDSRRHYGFYYHRQNKKCLRLSETEINYLLQRTSYGPYNVPSPLRAVPPSGELSAKPGRTPDKERKSMLPSSSTAA